MMRIEFTRDFFGSNTAFSNLYLWLNPQKEEFNYIEDNALTNLIFLIKN